MYTFFFLGGLFHVFIICLNFFFVNGSLMFFACFCIWVCHLVDKILTENSIYFKEGNFRKSQRSRIQGQFIIVSVVEKTWHVMTQAARKLGREGSNILPSLQKSVVCTILPLTIYNPTKETDCKYIEERPSQMFLYEENLQEKEQRDMVVYFFLIYFFI